MFESLPPVVPMLGTAAAVVVGVLALGLFLFVTLPALRGLTRTLTAIPRLLRVLQRLLRVRAAAGDPTRPLHLDGLSSTLGRFTRQTRTLALELRRASTEAHAWPDESAGEPPVGWRESLLGAAATPLPELRDQVFAWLRTAETLPPGERETLGSLGIDIEAVRSVLIAEGARATEELVRTLAGMLWQADERLAGLGAAGYRASGAEHPASASLGAYLAATPRETDEKTRRARWTGALADHGRGLSRMAGSYTRSAAEREDLEQDIALALWRALPTFRGESSLKTFAYKVARYCCFRHLRRRTEPTDVADPQTVADPAACIESAVLRADQRARIEQALTDLPNTLESVMTMHLTGHSYAQIAEALGITERNVSVRLTRARAQLRRQLVAA